MQPRFGIPIVLPADPAHRRDRRKTATKALYAAALVVDRNQQRRTAQCADILHQVSDLRRRFEVPGEQDDAADGGLPEEIAVCRTQGESVDVQHYGP